MQFTHAQICKLLARKKVDFLFHANTVTTACSLLKSGALLSRDGVEQAGLIQTIQYTDTNDKKFGVWDSVFLDTTDIHNTLGRHNNYGPVLFKFSPSLLSTTTGPGVCVTQCNPSKWHTTRSSSWWFRHYLLLTAFFKAGNFDQIIVVPSPGNSLKMADHLVEIILDDPQSLVEGENAFDLAESSLRQAAAEGGMPNIVISRRNCDASCKCVAGYQSNEKFRWKFFSPNIPG